MRLPNRESRGRDWSALKMGCGGNVTGERHQGQATDCREVCRAAPTLESTRDTKKLAWYLAAGMGAVVLLVLAVVAGHYIFVFITGTRFSVDQWSAAGGWVGGFGALAAVVVALWQIKSARDDAADAKVEADERLTRELEAADQRLVKELERVHAVSVEQMVAAEARHTAQLMKSDELLANELDAQRRAEQIRCIPPIWEEIANLAFPFQSFLELLQDVPSMPRTNDAAAEFMAKAEIWIRGLMSIEMGFSTAHLIVSEPHTHAALKDAVDRYAAIPRIECDRLAASSDSAVRARPIWTARVLLNDHQSAEDDDRDCSGTPSAGTAAGPT